MSFSETRADYQSNYQYAHDYWTPYVSDALVYSLAASGYTWSDKERKSFSLEGREPIEFNIIRRSIDFFSGYLRDNINSIVIAPVEDSDEKTADQFTKVSSYIWDKGGGFPTFLSAADECFKAGISLCGVQMDYSRDFVNGDISFFKRTFNSFYLDPTFEKPDLSDCGFAITRDLLNRPAIKQLLMKIVDSQIIDEIPGSFRDNKFINYNPQFSVLQKNRDVVAYDQYYRRTSRQREFLVDNNSSHSRDITDLSKDERERLELGINRMRRLSDDMEEGRERDSLPNLDIISVERPFIELNIMLNGEPVFKGEDSTGIVERYPFAPNICYFEPSVWMASKRVQGIVASEWSNQRQFNKRHMKIQDMFDTSIATGYKYFLGSVPDVADLQQSGQNKLIGVDPDNAPEGLNSVQELNGANVSPSLIEYSQLLDQLSLTLANINESSLGVDEGGNTQVSGRLAEVRIAQGLRSNRKVFDNIETSQQIVGSLVLEGIQNKYPPGKIERIIGEKPTDQFYESDFEQFDAVIKEGIRSKSQKDAYYYELVNLKRDGIVDVPQSEIIRALQMSGVSDLKEAIEAQEEERAKQQQKIDEQERMAMELANSQKEENLALAQSRRARVVGEEALAEERASESEENRAQAALARAKTITEIADLEDSRILKVLEFVNMLERQEAGDRDAIEAKIHARADQLNSETQGSAENIQKQALQQGVSPEVNQPSIEG